VQVKKEFNDDDEDSAYVPGRRDTLHFTTVHLLHVVPGAADNQNIGIRGARMKIKQRELKEVFDKVIPHSLRLAESQVSEVTQENRNAKVDAIVIVGGFGCRQYL
jgi:hypothetical protein